MSDDELKRRATAPAALGNETAQAILALLERYGNAMGALSRHEQAATENVKLVERVKFLESQNRVLLAEVAQLRYANLPAAPWERGDDGERIGTGQGTY